MATGFMGKKVNLFLLLMIILVLVGFGGVSIYYQYTFKNLNQRFNNLSVKLGVCEHNLMSNITALKNAEKALTSTETDIRKYDLLYEQKATELENKKTELAEAQAELTMVTLQKEVYKKQIDKAYAEILSLNNTISSLNQQIRSLNNQVEDQKDTIACLMNTDDSEEFGCI